jgi:hypothetical protein
MSFEIDDDADQGDRPEKYDCVRKGIEKGQGRRYESD